VRFCLVAHYQQAATLIRRNHEIGQTWVAVDALRSELGVPDRAQVTLMDATYGYRITNASHRLHQDPEISDVVASRDLKRLCELDLLVPLGEKRGRSYRATQRLLAIRAAHRLTDRVGDPYDMVMARARSTA
jgi:hypothetical protein